jgi:uncharacterized repeat protein (TIGR02543 family)
LTTDNQGNMNRAYHFNNSSIRVNHSQSLDIQGNITMSAWIKTSGTPNYSGIIHKYMDGTGATGFGMWANNNNSSKVRCHVAYNWPYGEVGAVTSKTSVENGKWHHLVCVSNGQTVKIYVDGIEENSVSYKSGMRFNNKPLFIGVDPQVSNRHFRGDIDGVRIYNRALSESEIKTLHNLGSGNITLIITKTDDGEITSTDNTINCGETCQADYEVDSTVTLTATPATGSTFTGWNGDCTGTSPTITVTMDAAKSCAATFKQSGKYLLKVIKIGEGRGTTKLEVKEEGWTHICKTDCIQTIHEHTQGSEVTLTANPATGFIFKSWNGDCGGTDNKITLTMNSSKQCTAEFAPNPDMLKLTVEKTGNGIVTSQFIDCGEICSAYYQPSQKVTLTATYEANTLFMGWTGDCSGKNPKVRVTMDADKACTATFQAYNPADIYSLNINKIGNGRGRVIAKLSGEDNTINCKTTCQQASYDYASGSQVILNANPAKGFVFAGWSGECSGNQKRITVLMDAAKNCTAQFDLKPNMVWHKLTVTTVGTGNGTVSQSSTINCGNLCSAYYQEGKTFWLKATPSLFSQFVGWSGDCTGTKASAKMTMTADVNCVANFQSLFEIAAINMVEAFYAEARLENGSPFSEKFPPIDENKTRLKESLWLNMPILMQTDQYLSISEDQNWPNQFDNIEWLPSYAITEYTQSIQMNTNEFVGIRVKLINHENVEEEVGIVIYYGAQPPEVDEGSGWRVIIVALFSRWAFRRWWW